MASVVLSSREIDEHLTRSKYDAALVTGYDLCPLALVHHHGINRVCSFSASVNIILFIKYCQDKTA